MSPTDTLDTFSASFQSVEIRHELGGALEFIRHHNVLRDLFYVIGEESACAEVERYMTEKPLGAIKEFGGRNLGPEMPDYLKELLSIVGRKEGTGKQKFITRGLLNEFDKSRLEERLRDLSQRVETQVKEGGGNLWPGFADWYSSEKFSDEQHSFLLPNYIRKALNKISETEDLSVSSIVAHGILIKTETVLAALEDDTPRTSGILYDMGPYNFGDGIRDARSFQQRVQKLIASL